MNIGMRAVYERGASDVRVSVWFAVSPVVSLRRPGAGTLGDGRSQPPTEHQGLRSSLPGEKRGRRKEPIVHAIKRVTWLEALKSDCEPQRSHCRDASLFDAFVVAAMLPTRCRGEFGWFRPAIARRGTDRPSGWRRKWRGWSCRSPRHRDQPVLAQHSSHLLDVAVPTEHFTEPRHVVSRHHQPQRRELCVQSLGDQLGNSYRRAHVVGVAPPARLRRPLPAVDPSRCHGDCRRPTGPQGSWWNQSSATSTSTSISSIDMTTLPLCSVQEVVVSGILSPATSRKSS